MGGLTAIKSNHPPSAVAALAEFKTATELRAVLGQPLQPCPVCGSTTYIVLHNGRRMCGCPICPTYTNQSLDDRRASPSPAPAREFDRSKVAMEIVVMDGVAHDLADEVARLNQLRARNRLRAAGRQVFDNLGYPEGWMD